MYEIVGRILTINQLSPKSSQVVIKKQVKGKVTPIAIGVYGYMKEKVDALKLQKNDKIVGRFSLKSNLYKGKWYTDFVFDEISRFVPKPKFNPYTRHTIKPQESNLFEETNNDEESIGGGYFIDEKTGEIIF